MADHVHFLISIPPKLAVSSVIGYIKGSILRVTSCDVIAIMLVNECGRVAFSLIQLAEILK